MMLGLLIYCYADGHVFEPAHRDAHLRERGGALPVRGHPPRPRLDLQVPAREQGAARPAFHQVLELAASAAGAASGRSHRVGGRHEDPGQRQQAQRDEPRPRGGADDAGRRADRRAAGQGGGCRQHPAAGRAEHPGGNQAARGPHRQAQGGQEGDGRAGQGAFRGGEAPNTRRSSRPAQAKEEATGRKARARSRSRRRRARGPRTNTTSPTRKAGS